ncbi:hypothetical protein FOVSG1_007802 [Fusarium oxysporum f. sp. vasinfectum]
MLNFDWAAVRQAGPGLGCRYRTARAGGHDERRADGAGLSLSCFLPSQISLSRQQFSIHAQGVYQARIEAMVPGGDARARQSASIPAVYLHTSNTREQDLTSS